MRTAEQSLALHRLAQAHGAHAQYHDVWGNAHLLQDDTARSLLAAMGVRSEGSETALQTARVQHEQRSWRSMVPPVVVFTHGATPYEVGVSLPESRCNDELCWRLRQECGDEHAGRFRPSDHPRVDSRVIEERQLHRYLLRLPEPLAMGYHTLELTAPDVKGIDAVSARVVVAPSQCYVPPVLEGDGRVWGLAVQLYAIRSARNWGVGDFGDLTALVDLAAGVDAQIIGVNPLHELFWHNPAHCSPYSPSSRLRLNPLYLDVEAVDGFEQCEAAVARVRSEAFQERLQRLRECELVDYPGVAAAKSEVLQILHHHFRAHEVAAASDRARTYAAFVEAGAGPLQDDARFCALQEHFARLQPHAPAWYDWPTPYRAPDTAAVEAFAVEHADRIDFFSYLQWLTDQQLQAVQRRALERGLSVGIYRDLAIGTDRGGADAWASGGVYTHEVSVGAPPDDLNLEGQDWGLPPLVPDALEEARYEPAVAAFRANMRHAGALRVDHVMGLHRLFWIPAGAKASEGAYVSYPLEDLMRILALESQRNRCLVIGEDLGTVPDEVREAAYRYGVLSYRLLWFERGWDGELKPPHEYPAQAAVAAATHDVPTLAGYWRGRDIDWRTQLQLFPSEELRQAHTQGRGEERARLLRALQRQDLLPEGTSPDPTATPELSEQLGIAAHVLLARTCAKVMVVQLEDVLGLVEQANLPGTVDEHPNWRRKLPVLLEDLGTNPRFVRMTDALRKARRTEPPHEASRAKACHIR